MPSRERWVKLLGLGTIIGVADVAPTNSDRVGLISAPSMAPTALATTNFLLDRDTPVPADEVRALNAHGISVLSREVIENPGSMPAPPGMASGPGTAGFDSGQSLATTAMLSLALLVDDHGGVDGVVVLRPV